MRSSKMAEGFPYASKAICYIEVGCNGDVSQIDNRKAQIETALLKVKSGESKLYAVWPGKYTSDLFEIDEPSLLANAYGIDYGDSHVHEVEYSLSEIDDGVSVYADVNIKFNCGCKLKQNNIKSIARELKEQLGWDMTTSTGFGCHLSNGETEYIIRVRRKSMH